MFGDVVLGNGCRVVEWCMLGLLKDNEFIFFIVFIWVIILWILWGILFDVDVFL